ncbi:MAG: T9SS type A sorting domain-containing protein [Bacteroidia bacterium]|nr:T9SS type A sorting domain-containing protein [Bacteroidia bacterium]
MTFHMLLFLFSFSTLNSQIASYVSNGSFESLHSNSLTTMYNVVKFWQPIDTGKNSNYLGSTHPSINNAPYAFGFQYPRSGQNYVICTFFCSNCPSYREYLRNRLKQPLQAGKTYCAKYHIVNTNNSPLAIDKYGIYFTNSNLDTINYCNMPLTYITPQIENQTGIITDTLNWVPITGTFVATGNEKYMVLGNFRSDVNTNTLLINPTFSATLANDVCIDDVSVIDIDLPAYAGPDIWGIPGNTVYIGRQQDVGIDEACQWFHLPNTTSVIATAAGLTLTVTIPTSTYMVKQDICGVIKYDTVIVYASGVGLSQQEIIKNNFNIFPIPAKDELNISFSLDLNNEFAKVEILNSLGQLLREEEIVFKNKRALIKTNELPNGVYLLNLKSSNSLSVSKRFVVAR